MKENELKTKKITIQKTNGEKYRYILSQALLTGKFTYLKLNKPVIYLKPSTTAFNFVTIDTFEA